MLCTLYKYAVLEIFAEALLLGGVDSYNAAAGFLFYRGRLQESAF